MMKKTDLCPCASKKIYADCCQRFWATQQVAATAEELMRSRYTAFVLEKASYLVATHHPDFRAVDELKSLKKSFKDTIWTGLEIIATNAGTIEDSQGEVEFIARFSSLGHSGQLHERSRFCKENSQWLYKDGQILNP